MVLSLLWASVLLILGGWWIHLMLNSEKILSRIDPIRFSKMLFWEGSSFIVLLLLLSASLLLFYIKDQSKTKSLQDFFASLTHELKTPLASIKLQGEVIEEILSDDSQMLNEKQLKILLARLIQDTVKLETQMDKILQLSRLERGGELNITNVLLVPFIKKVAKNWKDHFELQIICENVGPSILADEFALELILKNLFENTKIHSKSRNVTIKIVTINQTTQIEYFDHGKFLGDHKKLATLFYKHNSTKGSGIGLYLIKKLMEKMHGQFYVILDPEFSFQLSFKNSEVHDA